VAQAFPIVRRALKILADREVTPQTGLLKSTLLQLDSTFSERNYGASSFLDFTEKLAHAGFVTMKHSGRSVMVELNEGFKDEGEAGELKRTTTEHEGSGLTTEAESSTAATRESTEAEAAPVQATEGMGAGVQRAGQILTAATNARWPMYLRNVKQILRQAP